MFCRNVRVVGLEHHGKLVPGLRFARSGAVHHDYQAFPGSRTVCTCREPVRVLASSMDFLLNFWVSTSSFGVNHCSYHDIRCMEVCSGVFSRSQFRQ